MNRVGFTGSRRGMSDLQKKKVIKIINKLNPHIIHHGDCVGCDKEFNDICESIYKVIHPPKDESQRAFCEGDEILKEKPYLERNKDIVNCCDLMIATPFESNEILRSGTWSTIRYAIKENKNIIIVLPNGKVWLNQIKK
jgi:hypothetical protein